MDKQEAALNKHHLTHSFGMILVIASLAVLFLASMVAYLYLGISQNFPAVPVPSWYWYSTLVMVLSSAVVHFASKAAKTGNPDLKKYCIVTLLLSVVFLGLQVPGSMMLLNSHYERVEATKYGIAGVPNATGVFSDKVRSSREHDTQFTGKIDPVLTTQPGHVSAEQAAIDAQKSLYGMAVLLVVLHALHVIGGIVPLILVTKNAFAGYYSPANYVGVKLFAMYWHFLDVVWIGIIASLAIYQAAS